MDTLNADEVTPLVSISGISTSVRDTRQPYQKQLAIYLILASTLFERIAFYSLSANFAPSLQLTNDQTSSNSITGAFMFSGISYISTLIFAIITDAKVGRARTIIAGFILYLIGYILVTILTSATIQACVPNTSNQTNTLNTIRVSQGQCTVWTTVALIIIAIGAGAVKSNLAVFGAEQTQESKITSRYFDKYFVAVNIGIIIATLVVPNISNDPGGSFPVAYLFAACMLIVATLLFIIGYRFYIHVTPYDTVVINCIPVIKNAFQTWRQHQKNKRLIDKERINSSPSDLNGSCGLVKESIRIDEQPPTFLDFAKAVNHGRFNDRIVDDVKSLRKAFFVFSLLIPYWLIYNQLYTTFPSQGGHMRGSHPKYIVFWMSLGDPITIIIGTIILNVFVYKYLDARNQSLTIITKFVIGMFFASVTMCISGGIEVLRQQNCCPTDGNSTLSIYTELPQTIFMGFSELFATVACFEFSYFAAPRSAQSLFMSLYFCTVGLSSFIGTGYIAAFSVNSPKLDFSCPSPGQTYPKFYNYFFILAGIQLFFVIIFFICQKKFGIIKLNPQQIETN